MINAVCKHMCMMSPPADTCPPEILIIVQQGIQSGPSPPPHALAQIAQQTSSVAESGLCRDRQFAGS